ncbi:serine/threonine protein kinase [Chitinophaga varians]|uniref:serine/threonine protein kinase n=1 Tax=Chitinophaga varians TaxID=2202339 RepID=UPI00165FDE08|nr:protein kinase [Chitinophaga varians]MBC9915550.1 protein kinase [Chitinophaga varians]
MINELKETHNQNVDQQNGFHHLLDEMSIPYTEDEHRLNVGSLPGTSGWLLFLSVDVDQIERLIATVCPLLYKEEVAFSVVKNQTIAGQRNDFWFGVDEVGRMITVFTNNEKKTKEIVTQLTNVTKDFYGPEVHKAIRLGEIIYVAFVSYVEQQNTNGHMLAAPVIEAIDVKKMPFKVDRKYQYWKRKRLLKRRYVPLVMMGRSPKGDLLKSVDLKGLKFSWCFIKEGKYHVFNDKYGRYIKHRLQWQAKVLRDLYGYVPIPRFIDYFEQGEESYLVMELLEGVDLAERIEKIYLGRSWSELSADDQRLLVSYYLKVLRIIECMHDRGYVHRDATATNFMILHSGDIYAIDLELSYSINEREPNPPYTLGVFGYASPEQLQLSIPTVKEDVYTMGSLLLHMLSGRHPGIFINRNSEVNVPEIEKYWGVESLLPIMLQCFDVDPRKRPDLLEIRQAVEKAFN